MCRKVDFDLQLFSFKYKPPNLNIAKQRYSSYLVEPDSGEARGLQNNIGNYQVGTLGLDIVLLSHNLIHGHLEPTAKGCWCRGHLLLQCLNCFLWGHSQSQAKHGYRRVCRWSGKGNVRATRNLQQILIKYFSVPAREVLGIHKWALCHQGVMGIQIKENSV